MLLAGAHTRSGLAVARSLARRAVPLVVAGTDPAMAMRSRYVTRRITCPSPVDDPDAYFRCIIEAAERERAGLIIPFSDADVSAIDLRRKRLPAGIKVAIAQSDAVRNVLDKRANLGLARDLGIPCPRQVDLDSPRQIPELIEQLRFPMVLKSPGILPDGSRMRFPKVVFVRNEMELRGHIERYSADGTFPIVQELVTGMVHNVCCFAVRGEVVALHQYHSVRRYRGQGVMRRVTEAHPVAEEYARSMLRALQWDGVAHVGFFIDEARDRPLYMETNGRFWGSVQGSIHAGWDIPLWVYRYFVAGEIPKPGPLKKGSTTCWHYGDFEAMARFLRGGEIPATGTNPSHGRAVWSYLAAHRPGVHSDVWDIRDPVPALFEHAQIAKRLLSFPARRGH